MASSLYYVCVRVCVCVDVLSFAGDPSLFSVCVCARPRSFCDARRSIHPSGKVFCFQSEFSISLKRRAIHYNWQSRELAICDDRNKRINRRGKNGTRMEEHVGHDGDVVVARLSFLFS